MCIGRGGREVWQTLKFPLGTVQMPCVHQGQLGEGWVLQAAPCPAASSSALLEPAPAWQSHCWCGSRAGVGAGTRAGVGAGLPRAHEGLSGGPMALTGTAAPPTLSPLPALPPAKDSVPSSLGRCCIPTLQINFCSLAKS